MLPEREADGAASHRSLICRRSPGANSAPSALHPFATADVKATRCVRRSGHRRDAARRNRISRRKRSCRRGRPYCVNGHFYRWVRKGPVNNGPRRNMYGQTWERQRVLVDPRCGARRGMPDPPGRVGAHGRRHHHARRQVPRRGRGGNRRPPAGLGAGPDRPPRAGLDGTETLPNELTGLQDYVAACVRR